MIWWFIKKYWKLFGLGMAVLLLAGSLYFLYERSVSLEKDLTATELALEASESVVERLKQDKAVIAQANLENAKRQQEVQSKLDETQLELRKLRKESVENNEKGSECLNTNIPASVLERL